MDKFSTKHVGAGWGLMLFPMLLPADHHSAMILVTIIMPT